jgi:hypothetical protein
MERDIWVLLLTVLYLDYEDIYLSISLGSFNALAFEWLMLRWLYLLTGLTELVAPNAIDAIGVRLLCQLRLRLFLVPATVPHIYACAYIYARAMRNGIKRTNIYILSYKFVLNRLIYMEVRLIIFPLSCWCE